MCLVKYGTTTLECMLDDPLDNSLTLKDPQLGPLLAPKALIWPLIGTLGPSLASWLVSWEMDETHLNACYWTNRPSFGHTYAFLGPHKSLTWGHDGPKTSSFGHNLAFWGLPFWAEIKSNGAFSMDSSVFYLCSMKH